MRILITGSSGVLGKVLRSELVARGHDVFGTDLFHTDNEKDRRADIAEYRQLKAVFDFAQPELVYHLGAEFGRLNGEGWYEDLWRSNCTGTQNVISECLRTGAALAFASSSEAYGNADEYAPEGEDYREEWLDNFAPQFNNQYSLTKWVNERQIFMAAKNDGLKAVVLRFFNAYGPGERYSPYRSVVCLFTYRLLKGLPITIYKNYYRTHMFIDDWCRGVANLTNQNTFDNLFSKQELEWLGSGNSKVPVFNIGGTEYESVEALKDKIVTLIGGTTSTITYLDAEKANVISKKPDNELASIWLDHNPTTTLDKGLPPTIAWIRKEYGLQWTIQ